MPFNAKDIEIILGLFPEVMTVDQEQLKKKLEIVKTQIDTNNEFQEKILKLRKEFEELNKD